MKVKSRFLTDIEFPFCKGCSHHFVLKNIAKALEKFDNLEPLDVIIVTDIGCHGISDKCFTTHTVHGLHGRSTALGVGISLGLSNPKKKIIVLIGDGGATIGLQHILEAARLNIDMTVIVHNNFLYGMTGGQTSGLTPAGIKTTIHPEGTKFRNYDIVKLALSAGAVYTARIIGIGDFSDVLYKAFSKNGFSLVEVLEICTGYATKLNPGLNLKKLFSNITGEWNGERREVFYLKESQKVENLFNLLKDIERKFKLDIKETLKIVLAGSAGEGVQSAGDILAEAGVMSSLYASKKGSYPVTVGVGFSIAEVILSNKYINYTGIEKPDVVIIVSEDGLKNAKRYLQDLNGEGSVIIDEELKDKIELNGQIYKTYPFRKLFGGQDAILGAVAFWLRDFNENLYLAFKERLKLKKFGKKVIEKIEKIIEKKNN